MIEYITISYFWITPDSRILQIVPCQVKARVGKALQKSYSEKSGSKKAGGQASAGGKAKKVTKWLPCLVCGRSPKDGVSVAVVRARARAARARRGEFPAGRGGRVG